MLLSKKRILVTGVLNDSSIAFSVARRAQEEGAEVVLTSFGRVMSLTQRTARRLPVEAPVVELDVSDQTHLDALADRVGGTIDGVLHAIAFAPPSCLGDQFLDAPWSDVAIALNVSAYSLKALAVATLPLMPNGGSIVGLDFDNSQAWPAYDWMGVAKSALESVSRYLARDLGPKGVRVNLVAAGPLRTMAAKSIPGFESWEGMWGHRAPLGWDVRNAEPVASACVALLSDLFPATTGEIVHVDGGAHAIGAPSTMPSDREPGIPASSEGRPERPGP
jgi:meromycolic acid enoyl-[acyl-carrier protein] reductase